MFVRKKKEQEGQEGHQEIAETNPSLCDVKLKRVISSSGLSKQFFEFIFLTFHLLILYGDIVAKLRPGQAVF